MREINASQEKLQKILAQKASELLAKAQAMGGDLEKAAKEMGLEVKTSMDVNRTAPTLRVSVTPVRFPMHSRSL